MAEHHTASLIGRPASAPPVNRFATPGPDAHLVPSNGLRPPRDCGELPFLIKRDGTWLYRGTPIGRREMVCLFSSVLRREADGSYWLETPVERGRIEVEDTPWLAVEMDWKGDGRDQVLSFRTNVDQVVCAGPDHPIRVRTDMVTHEPTPYILVRGAPGMPPMEARLCRAVYYELVALAVPGLVCGRNVLGVWSQNRFFSLGELPNCADADPGCDPGRGAAEA